MIGVFVQWSDSLRNHRGPAGYVIDGNGCHLWVGATSRGYGRVHAGVTVDGEVAE